MFFRVVFKNMMKLPEVKTNEGYLSQIALKKYAIPS